MFYVFSTKVGERKEIKNSRTTIREQYPTIPWKGMAGMRDRLIHFYFGVSNEKVWRTVKEDIPTILPLIEQALGELKTINP